jgi:Mg2+ and Co2+ transporter CorA
MKKILGNTISQLLQCIDELKAALKKANSEAPKKAIQRYDRLAKEKLFPNTWKAICRRNGVYMARNQKHHNWHEDFANVILLPLTDAWDEEINKKMPSAITEYMKNVLEEIGTFFRDIQAAVVPVCDSNYKPLRTLLHEVRLLADQAKIQLSNIPKEDAQRYAQDIQDAVEKLVANTLKPYTSSMSKENGEQLGQSRLPFISTDYCCRERNGQANEGTTLGPHRETFRADVCRCFPKDSEHPAEYYK